MRIRVIQKPREACIDGIQLDRFFPGMQYEVGPTLGALFLAEGWAEPIDSQEPAIVIPIHNLADAPINLIREMYRGYSIRSSQVLAPPKEREADRRRHPRLVLRRK